MLNLEQTNQIQIQDINTRKELWNTLFCWIDFSKTKWKDKVYNKEYQFLPLTNTFVDWQKEVTELLITKHNELESLINSYESWFKSNVYPIIQSENGDKVLLFRLDRLFDNKMIGETSSLFIELLIFETDYLAKVEVKKVWTNLANALFFGDQKLQEQINADINKLVENRASLRASWDVYNKWFNLIREKGDDTSRGIWLGIFDLLKSWERGKLGISQWKAKCDDFSKKIEQFFNNEEQKDYFFSLAGIKKQNKDNLILATQNTKGWDLNNPYLMLFWFHQKPASLNSCYYRVYFVSDFQIINTRNLYAELTLQEDLLWKNYIRSLVSVGSLMSENHAFYHPRNLPE